MSAYAGPGHEGSLELKGQLFWKKFWFVLNGDLLQYYTEDKRLSTKGTIDLSKAQSVRKCGTSQGKDRQPQFEIVTKAKTYTLAAPTRYSQDEWVKLLLQAMQYKQRQRAASTCSQLDDEVENDVYEDTASVEASQQQPETYEAVESPTVSKSVIAGHKTTEVGPQPPKPMSAPQVPKSARPTPPLRKIKPVDEEYEDVAVAVAINKANNNDYADEENVYGEIEEESQIVQMRPQSTRASMRNAVDDLYGEIDDDSPGRASHTSKIQSMSADDEYGDIYGDTVVPEDMEYGGTRISQYIDELYGELEPEAEEPIVNNRESIYAEIGEEFNLNAEQPSEQKKDQFKQICDDVLTFAPRNDPMLINNDTPAVQSSDAIRELQEFLHNNRGPSDLYTTVRIKELNGNAMQKLKKFLEELDL